MMTQQSKQKFNHWGAVTIFVVLLLLVGCPPAQLVEQEREREVFDIRDTVVYSDGNHFVKIKDYKPNMRDQELMLYRCTWCHGCGVKEAWDLEHYGSKDWAPRYIGEEWAPIVQRMMQKENSLLQEEWIVRRIFSYLSTETLSADVEVVEDQSEIVIDEAKEPFDNH
jgi:hypothetical protein